MSFIITITDIGGLKASIEEQRIDRLFNDRTKETVEVPYGHRKAIGLGTYTTTDPKTGVTTVDEAGFQAEVSAEIAPLVGTDLAPFVTAAALVTAKADDYVVATVAAADAQAAKIVADAQAQAAAILQAAPPVDVGPEPVGITPLQVPPSV